MADAESTTSPAVGGVEVGAVGIWAVCKGADGKTTYYMNKETGESQSLKPADVEEAELDAALWDEMQSKEGYIFFKHRQTGAKAWRKPAPVSEEVKTGWTKRLTTGGRVFWKNLDTGEKSWEPPRELNPNVRTPQVTSPGGTAGNSPKATPGTGVRQNSRSPGVSALRQTSLKNHSMATTHHLGANLSVAFPTSASFAGDTSRGKMPSLSFAEGTLGVGGGGVGSRRGSPAGSQRGGGLVYSPDRGSAGRRGSGPPVGDSEELKEQMSFIAAEHTAELALRRRQETRNKELHNALLEEQKKNAQLRRDLAAARDPSHTAGGLISNASTAISTVPITAPAGGAASPYVTSPYAGSAHAGAGQATPPTLAHMPSHTSPLRYHLPPSVRPDALGRTSVTPLGGHNHKLYSETIPFSSIDGARGVERSGVGGGAAASPAGAGSLRRGHSDDSDVPSPPAPPLAQRVGYSGCAAGQAATPGAFGGGSVGVVSPGGGAGAGAGLPQAAELACSLCASLGPEALKTISQYAPDAKSAALAILALAKAQQQQQPQPQAPPPLALPAAPAANGAPGFGPLPSLGSMSAGACGGSPPHAPHQQVPPPALPATSDFQHDPEELLAATREASRGKRVQAARKAAAAGGGNSSANAHGANNSNNNNNNQNNAAAPRPDSFVVNLNVADDGNGGLVVVPAGADDPAAPGRPVELAFDVTHNKNGDVVSVKPGDVAKTKESRAERQLRKAEEELDAYADLVEALQEQLARAIHSQYAAPVGGAPPPPLQVLPRASHRGAGWDDAAFRELLRPDVIESQLETHLKQLPRSIHNDGMPAGGGVSAATYTPAAAASGPPAAASPAAAGRSDASGAWAPRTAGAPPSPDRHGEMQNTYRRLQALASQRPAAHRTPAFIPVADGAPVPLAPPMQSRGGVRM